MVVVVAAAEGVEKEKALIRHLPQALEAVPLWSVVGVVVLLVRQEVEEVEQTGQTD